jgi:hypothetical protein
MPYTSRPTLDDLLRDVDVDIALKQAWQASNPNAPHVSRGQPGSLKQEQGGFIYWNKSTGALEIERLPAGSRDGLSGMPSSDTPQRELVGSFHTHPNTEAEGYVADPSPTDRAFVRTISHVPEIIETHEGRKTIPYP